MIMQIILRLACRRMRALSRNGRIKLVVVVNMQVSLLHVMLFTKMILKMCKKVVFITTSINVTYVN